MPAGQVTVAEALRRCATSILIAHRQGVDVGEFVAGALATGAAAVGSTLELLANRPGTWEATLAGRLLTGTVGGADEDLDVYRDAVVDEWLAALDD